MKKKTGPGMIYGAFIVTICLSWLLWLGFLQFVEVTNDENRAMAPRPTIPVENFDTFFEECDSYINDRIPFRKYLVTINSAIDYFIFDRSANDSVVLGKEHWLFYKSTSGDDNDPIDDYLGKCLLSEDELRAIADNCIAQRDILAGMGKEFVIFIAPNKERIYSEYMPDRYGEPSDTYRVRQIVDYLREHTDLRVVYPYDELMSAKEAADCDIYYKTDTHWNSLGGYIGASTLLSEIGIDMPEIGSDGLQITKSPGGAGDLARMLGLGHALDYVESDVTVGIAEAHNLQMVQDDFYGLTQLTAQGADPRRIYVIRDSFATHMSMFISSQFDESYYRHYMFYTYDDIVNIDPDIVVKECVERNVCELGIFKIKP